MSGLQDMRRAAGFSSQREVAERLGVSQPSYARWEAAPEKMPAERAWQLADLLGTTIDAVVGRSEQQADRRDAAMRAYGELGPRSKAEAADFIAFLAQRDERERERSEAREEARWEAAASAYEDVMLAEVARDPEWLDSYVASSDAARRGRFEDYVRKAAGRTREGTELDSYVADVVSAWDRLHGSYRDPSTGWRVFWSESAREGGGAGQER